MITSMLLDACKNPTAVIGGILERISGNAQWVQMNGLLQSPTRVMDPFKITTYCRCISRM